MNQSELTLVLTLIIATPILLAIIVKCWRSFGHIWIWRRVAKRYDLKLDEDGWSEDVRMSGRLDGVEVSAMTITSGNRRYSHSGTLVRARIDSPAFDGVTLKREGLLDKVRAMRGAEDIQIGDPKLDRAFVIQGGDQGLARELLRQPELKDELLAVRRDADQISLASEWARITFDGRCRSVAKLERCIRCVIFLAEAVAQADPDPPAQEQTLPEVDVAPAEAVTADSPSEPEETENWW